MFNKLPVMQTLLTIQYSDLLTCNGCSCNSCQKNENSKTFQHHGVLGVAELTNMHHILQVVFGRG